MLNRQGKNLKTKTKKFFFSKCLILKISVIKRRIYFHFNLTIHEIQEMETIHLRGGLRGDVLSLLNYKNFRWVQMDNQEVKNMPPLKHVKMMLMIAHFTYRK